MEATIAIGWRFVCGHEKLPTASSPFPLTIISIYAAASITHFCSKTLLFLYPFAAASAHKFRRNHWLEHWVHPIHGVTLNRLFLIGCLSASMGGYLEIYYIRRAETSFARQTFNFVWLQSSAIWRLYENFLRVRVLNESFLSRPLVLTQQWSRFLSKPRVSDKTSRNCSTI